MDIHSAQWWVNRLSTLTYLGRAEDGFEMFEEGTKEQKLELAHLDDGVIEKDRDDYED